MNARVGLIHAVLLATANISATVPASHPSARNLGTDRMGSGTVVDPEGYILTVNYVANGATSIVVTMSDGEQYDGLLAAQDFDTGLALIKIDAHDLPFLRPAPPESILPGQPAFIIASSGEQGRRVSDGNVMSVESYDGQWEYLLETSIRMTAFNPGFGGGTLADMRGRLMGVVSLNLNDIGKFSLAIPAEYYTQYEQELKEFGRVKSRPPRPWLGFHSQNAGGHVVVTGITPGSPAEQSGMQQGDIILDVDARAVATRPELYRTMWEKRPGEAIAFHIVRGENDLELKITGGDRQEFNKVR